MENTDLEYAVADGIATITFNRPDKLNAFTKAMGASLLARLNEADTNDDVRVIVITGAGRAFCAGADLTASDTSFSRKHRADIEAQNPQGATEEVDWSDPRTRDFGGLLTLRMFDSLKPLIAAINGPAAGMGATLSLAADIRVASTEAKFAFPFVRRGITPESASAWFLPRVVGISRALEWMLTGRTFPASEALSAGLVRSLHEPGELLPAAYALAREIVEHAAPVSTALARQLLWRMLGADHPMEAHRMESRALFTRARATDIREGVASFFDKRLPQFKDQVSHDLPSFYPWWQNRDYF